jgi:hypothetical protein
MSASSTTSLGGDRTAEKDLNEILQEDQNKSRIDRVNSSGLQGDERVLARHKAKSMDADNSEIYYGETA